MVFDQPCYPSLTEVPDDLDLVIVGLGPARVAGALREAAARGARAAIVPGGGVVELGEAAAAMQAEAGLVAAETGIALLGPNCMGYVDYTTNVAAYIGDVNPWQRRGGFAGIAQSGSVTDAFIHATDTRVGWSRIISCGAEVALDLTDYMAWCLDDPATDGLVLFVEGFKRPERFLALADRALELGKPVLALKVGRSPQAQAASIAHSGSLAGEALVVDAALDAAGVQRFSDLDELLEAAELNAGCRRLGRGVGRGRVGLVTVSTGEASLVADLAPAHGVDLPPVPEHARERILRDLPTLGYVGNPLDPWGASDAESAYAPAFGAFAESGAFDVLGLVHDFPYRSLPGETALATELSGLLAAAVADRPDVLPVYVSLTSGEPTPEVQARLDAAGGIPLLRGAREALAALGARAGVGATASPPPGGRSDPAHLAGAGRRPHAAWCASRRAAARPGPGASCRSGRAWSCSRAPASRSRAAVAAADPGRRGRRGRGAGLARGDEGGRARPAAQERRRRRPGGPARRGRRPARLLRPGRRRPACARRRRDARPRRARPAPGRARASS